MLRPCNEGSDSCAHRWQVYNQGRDGAAQIAPTAKQVNQVVQHDERGLGGRHVSLRLPSAHTITIENVSGTAASAGKIICGPGAAACHGIEMRGVRLQTPASSAYTCQHAGNVTALDCSPQPCTGGGGGGGRGGGGVATCALNNTRGEWIPWVRVLNVSNVYGQSGPGGSVAAPLLGLFGSESECQMACERNANCTQYMWVHGIAQDPRWTHRCFARCDTEWALHPVAGTASARRVKAE